MKSVFDGPSMLNSPAHRTNTGQKPDKALNKSRDFFPLAAKIVGS
jgi:hypothetical protein